MDFSSLAILFLRIDSRKRPLLDTGLSNLLDSNKNFSGFWLALSTLFSSIELSALVWPTDLDGSGLLHCESEGDTLTPESQESFLRNSELPGPQESFLVSSELEPSTVEVFSSSLVFCLAGESRSQVLNLW